MKGFGPFDELTKDFTPERWARIEAIMAEMQEEDRLLAAEVEGSEAWCRPARGPRERESAGLGRYGPPRWGALKNSAETGR